MVHDYSWGQEWGRILKGEFGGIIKINGSFKTI
jgi:hypothetical protein